MELKRKFYPGGDFEKYLVEKKLDVTPEGECFYQYVFQFPNRFGLFITKNPYSSGYEKDLWDAAVVHFNLDPWCDYIFVKEKEAPDMFARSQTSGQILLLLRNVKEWPFDKYKEM